MTARDGTRGEGATIRRYVPSDYAELSRMCAALWPGHAEADLDAWLARGDAVARDLIRGVEAWARSRGYRELASDTDLENTGSQRAHARLGFEETERLVLFRKAL